MLIVKPLEQGGMQKVLNLTQEKHPENPLEVNAQKVLKHFPNHNPCYWAYMDCDLEHL